MREQLFVNYLMDYLRDVSGYQTCNIHKLATAMKKNYRIRDSLILYCALGGDTKKVLLNKYTNNAYSDVVTKINEKNFLDEEFADEYEFRKIWNSYQNKINRIKESAFTKEMARSNILKMMKEKGLSNYRVYTDLKLNPGNVNDYIKNNNTKKVSLGTVKAIFNYVYNYQVQQ